MYGAPVGTGRVQRIRHWWNFSRRAEGADVRGRPDLRRTDPPRIPALRDGDRTPGGSRRDDRDGDRYVRLRRPDPNPPARPTLHRIGRAPDPAYPLQGRFPPDRRKLFLPGLQEV